MKTDERNGIHGIGSGSGYGVRHSSEAAAGFRARIDALMQQKLEDPAIRELAEYARQMRLPWWRRLLETLGGR